MDNGNGYKIKNEHRLTSLEEKVTTILTNHLPHIQAAVDRNAAGNKKLMVAIIVMGILSIMAQEYDIIGLLLGVLG